jgi:Ca2+/Na+ antiporter
VGWGVADGAGAGVVSVEGVGVSSVQPSCGLLVVEGAGLASLSVTIRMQEMDASDTINIRTSKPHILAGFMIFFFPQVNFQFRLTAIIAHLRGADNTT